MSSSTTASRRFVMATVSLMAALSVANLAVPQSVSAGERTRMPAESGSGSHQSGVTESSHGLGGTVVSPRRKPVAHVSASPAESSLTRIGRVVSAAVAVEPDAPTGVSGVGGQGAVTLSWTAPASDGGSPVTGYMVTYADLGSQVGRLLMTGSPATSYTVTGLTNGSSYVFQVSAMNSVGVGPAGADVTVTPGTPSAPSGVTGVAGDGLVVLSWGASTSPVVSSPVTGYKVEYRQAADSTWTVVSTGSASTSYTVMGLRNGTGYVFRVSAVNAVGTGPASAESASVVPTAPAPAPPAVMPGAPTGLTGVPNNSIVYLSWTAPVGRQQVSGYTVRYRLASGTSWSQLLTYSSQTAFNVSRLRNGSAYVFRVAAMNASGTGPDSADVTVTPGTPSAPSGVTGVAGDGLVVLSWGASTSPVASSPVTGYKVEYRQAADSTWTVASKNSTSAPYTVTGLRNGTGYVFRVSAVNAVGMGPASAESAAIVPRTPAQAPTIVSAIRDYGKTRISWTTPAGNQGVADGYVYRFSVDGGVTWTMGSHTAGPSDTSITLSDLPEFSPYLVQVAAIDGGQPGPWSGSATLLSRCRVRSLFDRVEDRAGNIVNVHVVRVTIRPADTWSQTCVVRLVPAPGWALEEIVVAGGGAAATSQQPGRGGDVAVVAGPGTDEEVRILVGNGGSELRPMGDVMSGRPTSVTSADGTRVLATANGGSGTASGSPSTTGLFVIEPGFAARLGSDGGTSGEAAVRSSGAGGTKAPGVASAGGSGQVLLRYEQQRSVTTR